MKETLAKIQEWIAADGAKFGVNLLGSIAILVIGRWLALGASGLIRRLLERRKVDPIIAAFVSNLAYFALLTFVAVAAIRNLGIETASFVAVIGAAGLAIGLALQGSLSNFAAGFLLILFRHFKQGDFIEGAGTTGIVEEIQAFATILKTPDNKKVIVPNAKLTADNIINYSALDTRRVDMEFGVSYSDDLPRVKQILKGIIDADKRILKQPAPTLAVLKLADSSVNFAVRVWVKGSDYWDVYFHLNETVKLTFDREGVKIPFPQRDVHVYNAK
jgi:small conductance mechanosensitive channel